MITEQVSFKINVESISLLYESLYRSRYNSPQYKFKPTEKALQQIDKFIKEADLFYSLHSIGTNFIITYFLFQFNRVSEQTINRFSSRDSKGVITAVGKIQIYDIVGGKAFLYYRQRDHKFDFVIHQSPFIEKYGISTTYLKNLITKKIKEKSLNKAEELSKKRFFGTVKGTSNCIDTTTLFNHLSPSCAMCFFKGPCKQLLQTTYPLIATERGYNGNSN